MTGSDGIEGDLRGGARLLYGVSRVSEAGANTEESGATADSESTLVRRGPAWDEAQCLTGPTHQQLRA